MEEIKPNYTFPEINGHYSNGKWETIDPSYPKMQQLCVLS